MSEETLNDHSAESVEKMLRAELAQGDVIIATARPILRHLLANDEHALFSDEIIASVRGMMADLARQLAFALGRAAGEDNLGAFAETCQEPLTVALIEDSTFLSHAHALTIEAQLTGRIHQRSGIDPVLSPLLQELAAEKENAVAGAAMRVVTAQARFLQHVRRMELPLSELPGDLFHRALGHLADNAGNHAKAAQQAEAKLREDYDESDCRTGQIARLVMAMRHKAPRALAIDHAGLAIFTTALGMASDQDRGVVVLSLGENQCARLALALRAAGLNQAAVEEQFLYLHPDISLPPGFERLRADRAAALLAAASTDFAL